MNVTEHKHEVNICINEIQTSQLKEVSTLVITHGEKNQIWNVIIYTCTSDNMYTVSYCMTFIAYS